MKTKSKLIKNRAEINWDLVMGLGLIIIVSFLIVGVIISCFVHFNPSNGDGTKIGQVIKLSKQGMFNKTWEGQLIRGGLNGGNGGFGTQPFNFTIEGNELAAKVEGLMESNVEVKIQYNIAGIYSAFRSESSGHFLKTIEPLKK